MKNRLTRREFLKSSCLFCLGWGVSEVFAQDKKSKYVYEAKFYKNIDEQTLQCELCPNRCKLSNGQRGFCRAREPRDGKLYSLVYGKACAVHIDPIEKNPCFIFCPVPLYSLLPLPDAIFAVNTARIGKYPSLALKKRWTKNCFLKKWWNRPEKITAPALPIPIVSHLYFMNIYWIRQNWLRFGGSEICIILTALR